MVDRVQRWLAQRVPPADPVEAQQAPLVQTFLLCVLAAFMLGLAVNLSIVTAPLSRLIVSTAYVVEIALILVSFFLLRRGIFALAVGLTVTSLLLTLGIAMITVDITRDTSIVVVLTVPIVFAGLLLSRRGLAMTIAASLVIVLSGIVLHIIFPQWQGLSQGQTNANTLASQVSNFLITIVVLGLFVDGFNRSLRTALREGSDREQELSDIKASLEASVSIRTIALESALETVQQREAILTEALNDLQTSQATVRDLTSPILPVLPGVLAAPLIGDLDPQRVQLFASNVLTSTTRYRAKRVIFDITGVGTIDQQVAQILIQTTEALRLLGAEVLLVGTRPEIAETLVALNVDLSDLKTYLNLQAAVLAIMESQRTSGRSTPALSTH